MKPGGHATTPPGLKNSQRRRKSASVFFAIWRSAHYSDCTRTVVFGVCCVDSGKTRARPCQCQACVPGMRVHALLLQRKALPPRLQRQHDGKVAVAKSNQRWRSNGFEFRCDNGEPPRVTFALDCCDREAMSWVATTGGQSGTWCATSCWQPSRSPLATFRRRRLKLND